MTKRIPIAALQAKARRRPPGYLEDVLRAGRIVGEMLLLSRGVWAALCAKYRGPIPADQWPAWAKELSQRRTAEDSGLGDTLARSIGPIGGDAYKAWYKNTFGRPCGCAERQADLNLQYPYEITPYKTTL